MYDQRESFVSSETLQRIAARGELHLKMVARRNLDAYRKGETGFLEGYEEADRALMVRELTSLSRHL